jgi:hypothetical protein
LPECEIYDPYVELARDHVAKILRASHKWLERFLTGIDAEYIEMFEPESMAIRITVHMDERKAHEVGEVLRELKHRVKHSENGAWMRVTSRRCH